MRTDGLLLWQGERSRRWRRLDRATKKLEGQAMRATKPQKRLVSKRQYVRVMGKMLR